MVCVQRGGVILCGGWRVLRLEFGKCRGACGVADAPLIMGETSGWYGADWICSLCGDRWDCEYLAERPFRPRWRQESIARAAEYADAACMCPVERDVDDPVYPVACEHDRLRLGWAES